MVGELFPLVPPLLLLVDAVRPGVDGGVSDFVLLPELAIMMGGV
jgi:hypothetical protein